MEKRTFLTDPSGKPSSMRLAALFGVFVVLSTWCYISIQNQDLQDIPDSVVALVSALIAGKVVQRNFGQGEAPQP